MISAEYFDIFGFIGFAILFFSAVQILKSKDTDIIWLAENRGRKWQHVRWPEFPVDIFPNDEEAPNDDYRNGIREFEEEVNSIEYAGYRHRFVNLVDRIPDNGGRYDFSQDASWFRTHSRWRVVDGDSLIDVIDGEIYINNNTRYPESPIYHETENFLIIGRDSANPIDVQNAGGPIQLSRNDKNLLVTVKNMPPNYRKLLNHREN